MKLYFPILILILILLVGCTQTPESIPDCTKSNDSFGIYLRESTELLISDSNIQYYNESSHELHLNSDGVARIQNALPSPTDGIPGLLGQDFSAMLGKKRKYEGRFYSYEMSASYYGIRIINVTTISTSNPILTIDPGYPNYEIENHNSLINDPEILEHFKCKGKLIR